LNHGVTATRSNTETYFECKYREQWESL